MNYGEAIEKVNKVRSKLGLELIEVSPERSEQEFPSHEPIPQKPIPRDQWPVWAKALSQFSTPADKGIGDVVARMIGAENSQGFKTWHIATFGKPCGCAGRQRSLNIKYPLP